MYFSLVMDHVISVSIISPDEKKRAAHALSWLVAGPLHVLEHRAKL